MVIHPVGGGTDHWFRMFQSRIDLTDAVKTEGVHVWSQSLQRVHHLVIQRQRELERIQIAFCPLLSQRIFSISKRLWSRADLEHHSQDLRYTLAVV